MFLLGDTATGWLLHPPSVFTIADLVATGVLYYLLLRLYKREDVEVKVLRKELADVRQDVLGQGNALAEIAVALGTDIVELKEDLGDRIDKVIEGQGALLQELARRKENDA